MDHLPQLQELLSRPRRIAITTHLRPDGDALGSSLGLYHYLRGKGHKVQVISPTEYPDFLAWLPGAKEVLAGPDDPDRAKWAFESADVIFCLDFNDLKRVAEFEESVHTSTAVKVMVDHHLEPKDFASLWFWDQTASSTAEMIFRMIDALGDLPALTYETAVSLYVGLMTDTGSFRYSATTPAVHHMAATLIGAGIKVQEVHDLVFSTNTTERLRFTGYVLANCLVHLPELRVAYLKVDKSVFKQFNVRSGDTEGLVNYPMSIAGVDLAILMTEQDGLVKLSIRSRNGVASNMMGNDFGGGGHLYAAGGKSTLSMDETEQKIKDYLAVFMAAAPATEG